MVIFGLDQTVNGIWENKTNPE